MKRFSSLMMGLLVSVGLLAACGGPDHEAIEQAVYDGTDSAVDAVIDSLVLLEKSAMYDDATGGECWGEGPDEEVYCESVAPSSEELQAQYDEVRDELGERIFHSDNVEDSDSDSITLLLRGDIVCQEDDFFDDAGYHQCVQDVDALDIRLYATLVGDDTASIELWLGPDEIHPLTFTFGPEQLSIAAILENLEPAAAYVAQTFGEELEEFPGILKGEVEFGFFAEGDLRNFALAVHQDVVIEFDDGEYFALEAEAVGEVLSFGVDAVEEVLVGSASVGEFALTYEEWSDTAPGGFHEFSVQLAGLTSGAIFDPNTERIEWNDVGLGGGPAAVHIDGEKVLEIDLNSGLGGLFNAVLQEEDEALKFSINPGLELEIGAFFYRVADTFDDFEDWMLDEILSITLDGDDNPAVLIREYGVEVLRGHLKLDSASTEYGASVEAGMCLVEDDDADGYEPVHPFEFLEADQCLE